MDNEVLSLFLSFKGLIYSVWLPAHKTPKSVTTEPTHSFKEYSE
jgi:hypothetical protein